jgi:hypothetical protein
MARFTPPVAFLVALLVASAPSAASAQRPALAGEKARVAEAVKRDLERLATAQRTHHARTKLYATDLKDLRFTPTSGAEVAIAFGSMNAWAANASHPALSPVKCFVIVSAADAVDAPTSKPFCTDVEPGTAASRVAATTGATTAPAATPATTPAATPPAVTPATTPQTAPSTPVNTAPMVTPPVNRPTTRPAAESTPNTPAAVAPPRNTPRTVTPPAGNANSAANAARSQRPEAVRMITRDATSGVVMAERLETVTPSQFTDALSGMAREAVAMMDAPPPEVVRDPYESTQEFEARRAAALAEYQRREADYFRNTRRSFVVTLPVRAVRYDADREIVEFTVDAMRLPTTREGRSQLTLACFTRPAFWCMPDGMSYDAAELWRLPRATARQFDVLRTPLTLTARFTVGGRSDTDRALSVSLVDMELQARGQMVQRWPAR